MGKRSLKTTFLVLISLLILLCGTTFALMLRQTDTLDNQFKPAIVSCAVTESFDGTEKTSIVVKNTGNIDAYLRLRLISYWVDSKGNIVSKSSQMPSVSVADGWVEGSDNTYYYSQPVAPNKTTPNLLDEKITLVQENEYLQVVEVFADAIQSKPTDAVIESWHVTLDSNKIITAP